MTVSSSYSLEWAADAAERLMTPFGPRWSHVRSVAACAAEVARALGLDETVLVSAAWLHDIGYAAAIERTGCHALDGARHLRERGVDERTVDLVAHHSCAIAEADERGLDNELMDEFPPHTSVLSDALWYCDMVCGPTGERMTVEMRLDEIRSRYGPGHVVTRSAERATPQLISAVRRTENRLRAAKAEVQPM